MSARCINCCDPHMSVLLSPDGPLRDSTDENRIRVALPYEAPVEGAFPSDLQPPPHTQRADEDGA